MEGSAMTTADLLLVHPPSVYDFRKTAVMWGPVSDVIPATPVFETYPIGFLTIAEYLERHGFRVRIFNAALRMLLSKRFDLEKALASIDAPVVGIDLHWLVHAQGALEVARLVKECNPHSKVVLGGISSTYFHDVLLKDYPQVDMVLKGDSTEVPFLQLMEALGKGAPIGKDGPSGKYGSLEKVENLSWRDGNRVRSNPISHVPESLDHISLDYRVMVRSALRYRDIRGHLPYVGWMKRPLLMALPFRGCIHSCLACGGSGRCYRSIMGRKGLALRSPAKVAQDIASAHELVRAPVFLVHDPRMAGDKYVDGLLRELKATGTDAEVVFEYFAPPPKEYILRLAGATERFDVQISPESHDERVRRAQGRQYSTASLEKCLEATMEAGCGKLDVFFMIGLSGQDRQSVRGTVKYCGELMGRFPGGKGKGLTTFISPLAPFIDPGSAAFEEPQKHGYRRLFATFEEHRTALLAPSWMGALNYETDCMDRRAIVDATYEAGSMLNRLKLEHGRIDHRTAELVEGHNSVARELVERLDSKKGGARSPGTLSISMGGEICWKGELYWPYRGIKLNYARLARLVLTGK
jgi:B12-binding domain/radical SAM domain protein